MVATFEISPPTISYVQPLGLNSITIGGFSYPAPLAPTHPDGTAAPSYCALAVDRLLEQFKGKPKVEGLICALASRGTPIEQSLINVKEFRSLDTALGSQLDELGRLYLETREGDSDDDFRRRLQAMALVVASRGRPDEMLDVLIVLDNGFAPTTIALTNHFPACFIMEIEVPLGGQMTGESFARILKQAIPAGVCFQLQFQEQNETLFVWEDDTGEGWAEEDDLVGTGGVWAEAV